MRKLIAVAAAGAALVCVPVALAVASPAVTAGSTNGIGQSSATLHGTVNPNGLATTYHFDYGPTQALGAVSPTVPASAGAGTTAVSESTKLSGLAPGTTYYFELVASNSAGTSTTPLQSFKTTGNPAPLTTTSPAVAVGRYQATLVGIINPDNQNTTYHFEYGQTTAYGFQTTSKTLTASTTPAAVSIVLPGLAPGQVYHYRLVASHSSNSVTYGSDQTFQTAPWPRPRTHVYFTVRPRTAQQAPFVFVLTGRVAQSTRVPATYGCHGTVTIQYYQGRRKLAQRNAPVGLTTCTYRSRIRFAHISGTHRLTIRVHFNGDVWGAASTARGSVLAG